MPLTDEEAREIGKIVADEVIDRVYGVTDLAFHIMEHEATGAGRILEPARARATGCKCFRFDEEEYCWSPGVLGLMSSKKNPEQIEEFCVLGKVPAGAGAQKRFRELRGAIHEAQEEWERKGEGLPGWWRQVGEKLAEKGIEL